MTMQRMCWVSGAVGVITTLLLAVGADSLGGTLAFFQLGFLVGAPLAIMLRTELRSWPMAVVIAVPLSIALTAIAAQFLIWFRIATGPLIVLTASTYGIVLALLVASATNTASRVGSETA